MEKGLTEVLLNAMTEKQVVKKDLCCHGKLKNKRAFAHYFLCFQGLALSPHASKEQDFLLKSRPLANLMQNIRKTKRLCFEKLPAVSQR